MPYAQKTVFGTSYGNMSPQDQADAEMQRQQMALQAQNQSNAADIALRSHIADMQSQDNRYNTDAGVAQNGTFGARSALEQQLAATRGQTDTNIAHINMGPNQEYADLAMRQYGDKAPLTKIAVDEATREAALRGQLYGGISGMLGLGDAGAAGGGGGFGMPAAGGGGVGMGGAAGAAGAGAVGGAAAGMPSPGAAGAPSAGGMGGMGAITPQQRLQVMAALLSHSSLPDFGEQDARLAALRLQTQEAARSSASNRVNADLAAGDTQMASRDAAAGGVPVPMLDPKSVMSDPGLQQKIAGLTGVITKNNAYFTEDNLAELQNRYDDVLKSLDSMRASPQAKQQVVEQVRQTLRDSLEQAKLFGFDALGVGKVRSAFNL